MNEDKAIGLEIRSVEVRSVDTDKREITGLAVPYNQTTEVAGYKERFEKGAFGKASDVKLFYGHSEPIGLVTNGVDTDEGYLITARISDTPRGNEVYTLMKDEVLNKFSVGFLPVEHRMDEDVVVRTKATLKEVSVVAFPAYEGAKVSEVRDDSQDNKNTKEDINMSNEEKYAPESEVADLRGSVEDLERRVALFGETKDSGIVVPQFRSGGEFLKALAAGNKEARDFATTVEADVTRPSWVNNVLRIVDEQRVVANLFNKSALPASGNSIEYPYVSSTSGTVEAQSAEGAALPYMEVAVNTRTAPVVTYGGYSSLSRQAIERSDIAYLETVLRYMAVQYAKATELAIISEVSTAQGTGPNVERDAAKVASGWLDAIVNASAELNQQSGLTPDFVVVDSGTFLALVELKDTTNRPLLDVNGDGANTYGTANIKGNAVRGTLAGLPVVVDWTNAVTPFVASREAVTVFESAGAPFRLQDENIINLTKDFSLYGYMAVAVTNPDAIVSIVNEV